MASRFGMGGSADTAQAGTAPKVDRRIDQAGLRKMVRQDLRLRANDLREFFVEDVADACVQFLALTAQ